MYVMYFPACTDMNGTVPNCADVPLRICSLTHSSSFTTLYHHWQKRNILKLSKCGATEGYQEFCGHNARRIRRMSGFCAREKLTENFWIVWNHQNWAIVVIRHWNTKVRKSGEGNDEIIQECVPGYRNRCDNIGQMIAPMIWTGWRLMRRLQQRKIVIIGEGYYAPPTVLMEEDTEWRRPPPLSQTGTVVIYHELKISSVVKCYTVTQQSF